MGFRGLTLERVLQGFLLCHLFLDSFGDLFIAAKQIVHIRHGRKDDLGDFPVEDVCENLNNLIPLLAIANETSREAAERVNGVNPPDVLYI